MNHLSPMQTVGNTEQPLNTMDRNIAADRFTCWF